VLRRSAPNRFRSVLEGAAKTGDWSAVYPYLAARPTSSGSRPSAHWPRSGWETCSSSALSTGCSTAEGRSRATWASTPTRLRVLATNEPELAPPGWRAKYADYLILGLTTSTAFSPTDVMPMVAWAKLTMALQSIISLSVIGLVIARAVNVFS
jgi:hypothetical protein